MEKKYYPHCGKELILDYDIIDDDYTNPRYYYRCDCENSKKGINSEERQNTNNMEKVVINGKEYQIDIDKCKKEGLLVEEKSYPKDWEEYKKFKIETAYLKEHNVYFNASEENRIVEHNNYVNCDFANFNTMNEAIAFVALGKLIQLRDWWWDNMCDGWRPEWKGEKGVKFIITVYNEDITKEEMRYYNTILAFPSAEIRDEFYEVYKDLIKEAKMFL